MGASVRPSVRPHFQTYISKTSRPIAIKLYQKHHCGGGLPVLGFEADKIRTLVSMATDSSHRLIMGESLSTL